MLEDEVASGLFRRYLSFLLTSFFWMTLCVRLGNLKFCKLHIKKVSSLKSPDQSVSMHFKLTQCAKNDCHAVCKTFSMYL